MGFLKFLFKAALVVAVLIGVVLFAARFNDGPLEIIAGGELIAGELHKGCLLYTSPSPRDLSTSRMPSSA